MGSSGRLIDGLQSAAGFLDRSIKPLLFEIRHRLFVLLSRD